ncbi:hypothetical protein ACFL2V_18880 [Pseudomonadota bacterium]
MTKLTKILVIATFVLLALPLIASAQGGGTPGVHLDPSLQPTHAVNVQISGEGEQNQAVLVNIILQVIAGSLIYMAGPLAVLILAFGGVQYVTSHGDQNMMEGAKKTITWAIVGLGVIMVSYAIVWNIIRILQV